MKQQQGCEDGTEKRLGHAKEECLFLWHCLAQGTACLSVEPKYTSSRNSKASKFLASITRMVRPVRFMGPGKSDKAAHEFDKVDICESYSKRDLDLYLNCPVRYRYTVVERLQGEWDGSTYLQFHRCVYITIAWLEEERQKGNAVGSSEALSQSSSLWASGGPGEYRIGPVLRRS